MNWLQITLALGTQEAAEFETVLQAHGAVAITYESQADEVVLEPKPGEIPLWQHINLVALFSIDTNISGLNEALRVLDAEVHERLDVAFVAEEDWQQRLANHTVSAEFGGRLLLLPKIEAVAQRVVAKAEKAALYLEPGLAFGSGSHPTTRMCLEWLASHIKADQVVLDFGCGSGILAIGAALLGARVIAVDHDDQAITATRENAQFNGVSEQIQTLTLVDWGRDRSWQASEHFDVVVANILAAPLIDLAPTFSRSLRQGGSLVLAGILDHQASQVMQAYPGVKFGPTVAEDEWVCLAGTLA
ncbi:MAG: 50S ribosomal protein L11 methyltransferase [Gammaproteobacteria bacterium]|nr:50S ribosomal protein L11 methyltransferase [Gammaproteobacteria bacterium]